MNEIIRLEHSPLGLLNSVWGTLSSALWGCSSAFVLEGHELSCFLDCMSFSSLQDTVLPGFTLFEVFHRANPMSTASEKSKLSSAFGLNRPPEASLSSTLIDIPASILSKVCAMAEWYKIRRTV